MKSLMEEEENKELLKPKKEIPPDTQAAIYLLQVKFCRTYNPRKDQIDIIEKKAEGEQWADEPDKELIELNIELVKAKTL